MKKKTNVKHPVELFGTLKSFDMKKFDKDHNEECEH